MKAGEIIRIIIFSLLGAVLMFWIQPWIYQNRFIQITDVPKIEAWVSNYYTTGATVVFTVSLISTLLWYGMAAKAQIKGGEDAARWSLVWWLIFLLPILSICLAIYFFRGSEQALLSLTGFFIFDVLVLFWFSTVTSSPQALMYAPPGAFLIRRLVGF